MPHDESVTSTLGRIPTGDSISGMVLREKMRMAIDHLYASLFSGLYCGGVLIAIFAHKTLYSPYLPHWIAIFLGVTVIRILLIKKLRGIDLEKGSQQAFQLFQVDAQLAGGSWGVIPLLLMSDNPAQQAFIAVLIAGIGSGGIIIRAPLKSVARPFILTVTAPLILTFFSLGTPIGFAIGALSLAFPIVLLVLSNQIETQINDALTLTFEKQELIGRLSLSKEVADKARSQAESANRELNLAMEKVMAATEAKGRFLANVSHEIRTPMNGVLGMTNILLSTSLAPEQREMVTTVKGCAESLLVVINDILDFSKIEAGKLDLIDREFDPRACFEAVADAMAFQAAKKHLEFSLFIRNDVPMRLRGDPDRIRQVMLNLVGNAVKFTERGEVRIDVAVGVGSPGPSELHVEVNDTGIGITQEQRAMLFQPFSQVDSSSIRRFGGTGLGLVITKNLVELMGGRIELDSEVGKGSTFRFRLPLRMSSPSQIRAKATLEGKDGKPVTGRKKILVVESSEHLAAAASAYLEWAGYQTVTATRFYDALGLLKPHSEEETGFHLALVSFRLSQQDGLALAERIRALPGGDKLIMILGLDQGIRVDDKHLAMFGIAGTLNKPLKRGNLVAMVRRLLGDTVIDEPQEGAGRAMAGLESAKDERGKASIGRILVVEDQPVNQKVIGALLQRSGLECTIVENGPAALEEVRRQAFDLIFMDIHMDGMDGFATTAAIRDREAAIGIRSRIVALTASISPEDRQLCRQRGFDGVMGKPVDPKVLHDLLKSSLPGFNPG